MTPADRGESGSRGRRLLANFQPMMMLEQQLVAVMAKDHPLAARRQLRLSDCAAYPVAMPERSIGGRQLLEEISARNGLTFNIAAESNSFEMLRGLVIHAGLISFQIQIGTLPSGNKLGSSRAKSTAAMCRAPICDRPSARP